MSGTHRDWIFMWNVFSSRGLATFLPSVALISVWLGEIDTLIAVFPTGFSVTFPFDVLEIYMFILIGIVCGFGGAFYVYSHRR